MIKHIVAFRLVAETPTQKAVDSHELSELLTGLRLHIPFVNKIEVGADLGRIQSHWDLVLTTEHPNAAALEDYQAHPAHQAALVRINQLVNERAVVDYDDAVTV